MPSELHGGRLAGWVEDVFTLSGAGPYTLSKQIKGEVMMAYLDGRRRPLSEFTVDSSADPSTVTLGGSLTAQGTLSGPAGAKCLTTRPARIGKATMISQER